MVFDRKYVKISLNSLMKLPKYFSGLIFSPWFFFRFRAPKQGYDLSYVASCENAISLLYIYEIEFNIFLQIKVASYLTDVLN